MKVVVSTYYFSIFVQYNTFTDKVKPIHSCNIMHFTIASEKARQNRKIRMELNKQKKSRFNSIHKKKNPESNKHINKHSHHDIDFNLVEPTEKGMFYSQYEKTLLFTY